MPVRRDSTGRWRFRTVITLHNGDKCRISGSAPRNDNTKQRALFEERAAILRAEAPPVPVPQEVAKPAIPMMRDFASLYLDAARIHNKPAGVKSKTHVLKNHIVPFLGDLPVDGVTYAKIEDFKVHLANKRVTPPAPRRRRDGEALIARPSRPLDPRTINNVLYILRHLLVTAEKRGLLAHVPKFEWLRAPMRSKFDFLTFEESGKLLSGPMNLWRLMVLVALRTGLRRGELLGLQWEDVDLDRSRIVVSRNFVLGKIGTPKSGKSREVALGHEVREALRTYRDAHGGREATGPVFCGPDGKTMSVHVARRGLKRITRAAGLRSVAWHTMRHTFASHLVMRGVPLRVVQELLGHSTILMTMRYAHLAPEATQDAVRLLDSTNQIHDKPVANFVEPVAKAA